MSAIAQRLEIDRKTVRKYLQQQDFSPTPPVPRDRVSKVEPLFKTVFSLLNQPEFCEEAAERFYQAPQGRICRRDGADLLPGFGEGLLGIRGLGG